MSDTLGSPRLRLSYVRTAHALDFAHSAAPAYTGEEWLPNLTYTDGVRIADERHGAAYVVTVQDRGDRPPALTSQWRAPLRGALTTATFEGVTWRADAELAAVAVAFLRRRAAWRAQQDPRILKKFGSDYAEHEDESTTGKPRPSLEQVAAETRLAIQAGVPQTDWFGEHYGISAATAQRWVRAARLEGLLPELSGKRGRPPKTRNGETT